MKLFNKLKKYPNIAIMGGSFDPIHYGHLLAAEMVRERFFIDKVVFIPSGNMPHKDFRKTVKKEDRYQMTKLAIESNEFFEISDIEIKEDKLSYTFNTISKIKDCLKDSKIYFITGADAVSQILTWNKADELLNLCEFVAVSRPGHTKENLQKNITKLRKEYNSLIHYMEIPSLSISSTDIRNRVKVQRPIKYLLPDCVEDFIKEKNLYKGNFSEKLGNEINPRKIKVDLSKELGFERYLHTLSVADEAIYLANIHGEDFEKTYLSALLHDCAKDYRGDELKAACKKYNINLDDLLEKHKSIIHQFLGRYIAEDVYGIKDNDILNAIKYHTTARKNMSKLEKITYLADYIEANKQNYYDISKVRDLAYRDLDLAMKEALKESIEYLEKHKKKVHPLGIEALKYYSKK